MEDDAQNQLQEPTMQAESLPTSTCSQGLMMPANPNEATLTALPNEILLQIFTLLDCESAFALCQLNHRAHRTLHPRLLPLEERARFLEEAQRFPRWDPRQRLRYPGPWDRGLGCYACCRVRPGDDFELTQRAAHPPRHCLDCGFTAGRYAPGALIFTAAGTRFVCTTCRGLGAGGVAPVCVCDDEMVCGSCWREVEGLDGVLCRFCRLKLQRLRSSMVVERGAKVNWKKRREEYWEKRQEERRAILGSSEAFWRVRRY